MNNQLLIAFLVASAFVAPVTFYGAQRLRHGALTMPSDAVLRYWLLFLTAVLLARGLAGIALAAGDFNLWAVQKFYPIRIAGVNSGLLWGLPYAAICAGVIAYLPRIAYGIEASRWRFALIWAFSVALLLAWGAIHGGLIAGNIGVATSTEALFDARLNPTAAETFRTYIPRILGQVLPQYHAPHSLSHPAASVVYWEVIALHTAPFVFSLINVAIFALCFPVVYWMLCRHVERRMALQTVLAALTVPAILIYGRSDDAVYYAIAIAVMGLSFLALRENRYALSAAAGAGYALALSLSYGAIVLLPAMFSFTVDTRVGQLLAYFRRLAPHFVIVVLIVLAAIILEMRVTGFNPVDGFWVSAAYNRPSTIAAILAQGLYVRALDDRVMAVCDFLLFGGPLVLYLLLRLFANWPAGLLNWRLRDVALTVLLLALAIGSNGPGEVARPWGSLYLFIVFLWFHELFGGQTERFRWWLIRAQLVWALSLQLVFDFGW